MVKTATDQNG